MLTRDVVAWVGGGFGGSDADDAESRVFRWICELAFKRFESAPNDVGFAESKLSCQPLQSAALHHVEVDLQRLAHALSLCIMSTVHES